MLRPKTEEVLLIMEQRIHAYEKDKGLLQALYGLGTYVARSSLEKPLLHLIELRVSQINGCAYCLDMHSKESRAAGETEQRLYMLEAWRITFLHGTRTCRARLGRSRDASYGRSRF